MSQQSINSIISYSVDAAASGGPCSKGNSSQTPSRCSWVLTLGQMGPWCQNPSDEQNTERKSKHRQEVKIQEIKPIILRCLTEKPITGFDSMFRKAL